ncbi:MAG: MFS transporter [Clostridia bacterium]|nr:MFS transporter [Clostridia bacterium]
MKKPLAVMPGEKKNERFMLTAVFLFWFSVYTYPSFLTTYAVNGLGATKVMAGMIVGSYGLTQMLLRIPLGILSDVLKKRKPFVMLGFGLSILASAGLSAVAAAAGLENVPKGLAFAALIFRGISGMTAATWVNFSVLYSASCQGDQVAAAMSRIVVPQCGSQIVAMLLGAQLAGHLGELYAFLLATAAGIAGLIVMAGVREQPPTGEPMTLRGFAAVAGNRQLIAGTILATIYQLVVWATVQGFVQNWARDVIGLTTSQLGYLSVANLLPNTVLSRFSGTVFSRRFGRRVVLTAGFAFLALACCLYPATNSLGSLLAVQALLGSGVGLILPLTMSSAIESVPNERRGAAMGIYQAVYGLGMFLGPVIAGAVIERFSVTAAGDVNAIPGYVANFYVAMSIAIAGGVLAVLLTPGKQARREEKRA